MEKKKLLFIILMIIACFSVTGCQNKNNQKDKAESNIEETYKDENEDKEEHEEETGNKKIVTITFDSDGGTPVDQIKVTAGDKITAPKEPKKENYKFLGWYNGENAYDFTNPPKENIVLKAKWEKVNVKTYTITFNSNGGSKVNNQTVKEGYTVKKPSNPTRSGYAFVRWELNGKSYNFDKKVEKNITLKAIWLSVPTPKLTAEGKGCADGTCGKTLKLDSTKGITGVAIYSATSKTGTYTLLKKVKIGSWNNETATVYAKKGQHLYFKVKIYKINDSKTYYSEYSNVIELNNSLETPNITVSGYGFDAAMTLGKTLKLNSTDGITGIEIYSATSKTGTYTLLKKVKIGSWNNETATVYAKKGQCLYYRVRTYKINDSKTYYSGYSNVIELDNSLATPKLTEEGKGCADGVCGKTLKLDSTEGITGIEIYSSTSENGTYTLLKTVKIEDWNNEAATVYSKIGQSLYYRVRTYIKHDTKTYYSGYSNII